MPPPPSAITALSSIPTAEATPPTCTVDPSLREYLAQVCAASAGTVLEQCSNQNEKTPPLPVKLSLKESHAVVPSRGRPGASRRILTAPHDGNSASLSASWGSTPVADFNECFRLFFGSNITIYPFLVYLGGTVGAVLYVLPMAYLLQECVALQCGAKDVAVNMILPMTDAQLGDADDSEVEAIDEAVGSSVVDSPAGFGSGSAAGELARAASCRIDYAAGVYASTDASGSPPSVGPLSSVTNPSGTASDACGDAQLLKQKQRRRPSHSASKHYASVNSYNRLGEVLWAYRRPAAASSPTASDAPTTSVFPAIVRGVIFVAQHISSCTYSMLLASNVHALAGPQRMSLYQALTVVCVMMAGLLIALTPRTLSLYSAVNNVGLLAASVILTLATLFHQNSAADQQPDGAVLSDEPMSWAFSKSAGDFFLFFPIFVGYMTPAIFVMDVETSIARRSEREQLKREAAGEQVAPSVETSQVGVVEVARRSSTRVLAQFQSFTRLALVVALIILLSFGEFIFYNFGPRTNAVVALSLHPGVWQDILLIVLIVSQSAASAINMDGLPKMLDDMDLTGYFLGVSSQPAATAAEETAQSVGVANSLSAVGTVSCLGGVVVLSASTLQRIAVRCCIMIMVALTLFVVPFFDLVAALGGALGVNGLTFFLPVLFYLQAVRREIQSVEGDSDEDVVGWWEAFCRVPSTKRKLTMAAMLLIGTVMLTTGVVNFALQFAQRVNSV